MGCTCVAFFLLLFEERGPVGVGALQSPLDFKDVHRLCWGGGCVESGPASAWAAARSFPQ
jgi:hypothetical protein